MKGDVAACANCGGEYVKKRRDNLWCSDTCRNKERSRRYRTDSRKKHLAYVHKHYADNRSQLLLDMRNYRRSLRGKLVHVHASIMSRVSGRATGADEYIGLPAEDRNSFIDWSLADPSYNALHKAWAASGYAQAATPSIDRVDSDAGYVFGNMRWITQQENSRLGAVSRWRGRTKACA